MLYNSNKVYFDCFIFVFKLLRWGSKLEMSSYMSVVVILMSLTFKTIAYILHNK